MRKGVKRVTLPGLKSGALGSGVNNYCAYYPCHDGLEDCTFCYCPYYPCKDKRLGSYIKAKRGGNIWSCKDCGWIHRRKVVDKIFALIRSYSFEHIAPEAYGKFDGIGVVILGHGSRLKKANDTLRGLAKKIRTRHDIGIVEPAFLQLCKPRLEDAICGAAKKGCKTIVIVPYFLFVGNHVSRDIPKIIAREADKHTGIRFIYANNLGQDGRMEDIVMDRIREAIG